MSSQVESVLGTFDVSSSSTPYAMMPLSNASNSVRKKVANFPFFVRLREDIAFTESKLKQQQLLALMEDFMIDEKQLFVGSDNCVRSSDGESRSVAFLQTYRGGGGTNMKGSDKVSESKINLLVTKFTHKVLALWNQELLRLMVTVACSTLILFLLLPLIVNGVSSIVGMFRSTYPLLKSNTISEVVDMTKTVAEKGSESDDIIDVPLMNTMKTLSTTDTTGNMDSYTTAGLSFFLVAAARLGLR